MSQKIIRKDETDEAKFRIRFKGIERYYEYESFDQFIEEWQSYDNFMKEKVLSLEEPKTEARRKIDLFLRRTKKIPTTSNKRYYKWKTDK